MPRTSEGSTAPRKRLKNDLLLIGACLLATVLVGVFLLFTQKSGDTVEVSVNGTPYGSYSLHKDTVVDIVTEAGYNRLVIKDRLAYVEAADCPDGICAAHRPISGTRESIVCLPHGVVITVSRSYGDDAPDIVVQRSRE